MEKMEEKEKVKVKMKKDKSVDENSLEEGIPEVPSMQELLGIDECPDASVEENIDKTEMKFPADHENTNTNENTENPLSEEANDSIIETNIDTVKQVEEEPIMTETNDIATVEQQLDDTKESTNEEAPKTYAELDQSLINMEPHFFLNKELENLKLNELSEHIETAHENLSGDNLETSKAACDKISGSLYPTEELPRAQMDYFAEAESDVYAMANAPMDASYNEHLTAAEASAPPMFEDEVQDYMAPSAPSFEPMSANHQHQEYYQQDYEYTQTVESPYEEYVGYDEYTAEYEAHVTASSQAGQLYQEEQDIELTPFTDNQLLRLYHNVELEKNQEFVNHWLQTQQNLERFELDELLTNYQRVRMNLLTTQKQLKALSNKVNELQNGLWTLSKEKVEEEGECEDGVIVIASRDRNLAEFNEETAKALRVQFKQGRELFAENLALFNFRSELCRIKIDDFVHSVFERSLRKNTEKGASVYTPQEELRLTVSILFKYLRKDLDDAKLIKDLKIWLDRAVGVVLVQSTLYDHLFILNHLMRCPAGVGIWGACFLQPSVPTVDPDENSFENPFLDNIITILATILLPVKDRPQFIQEFKLKAKNLKQSYGVDCSQDDNIWTVLDGEGSEEENPEHTWADLREADLIALFNQIPIDHLFRYVLRIEERDGKDNYDIARSSQHSLLKLFAFATQFVYLLREGLKTFNTPKYRQFAKRLGSMIRLTVNFVSDHLENFKSANSKQLDPSMMKRLEVEYDYFFLRCTKCIFSSMKLGIWQYLSDIPYKTVSSEMLWRIFYVLHLDYQEDAHNDFGSEITDWSDELSSPDLHIQFEEKCRDSEESELFFLFSAFAKMATSRKSTEAAFIKRVVLDLFIVGFASESTRETNCKNCRDLLAAIASQHQLVLAYLLELLQAKITDLGKLSTYLVQGLPWSKFKPTDADLEILFTWLDHPVLESAENLTARTVLTSLNWETWGHLPVAQHAKTAIAVCSAMHKLKTALYNQGIVNSSVSTMSNLAMATLTAGASVPAEQLFISWSWQLLSRLRVHLLDRTARECELVLSQRPEMFKLLLDFDLSQDLEDLVSAAISKEPGACYTVMLLTQVGHSLPEILERGLDFVKNILDSGDYIHTVELMFYILPVLLSDLTSLDNDKLLYILMKLTSADNSYISLAKSMLTGSFPGMVTKHMGHMMNKLVSNFDNVGQYSRKDVINLLLKLLTRDPNWSSNPSILYLLDIVCSNAFNHSTSYFLVLEFFEKIHTDNNKKETGAVTSGFLSYIPKLGGQTGYVLTLAAGSCSQFPWLAFFILQAEDNFMQKTGFWKAMINELVDRKSVEEALVAAEKRILLNPPSTSQLIIYRWVQQAMDTPVHHPISFLFWQKFFILFFSRPTSGPDGQDTASVGSKFFDGMLNSMFLNKIKTNLKAKEESFGAFSTTESADSNVAPSAELKAKLSQLFKAYYLWLTDEKLLDAGVYIPVLKPSYEPSLLVKVISGETGIWMEYFDDRKVPSLVEESSLEWSKSMHRIRPSNTAEKSYSDISLITEQNAEARIIQRLKSFETRLPKPPLRRFSRPIPVHANIDNKETLRQLLLGPLQSLNDFSETQSNNIGAYGSLNCSYLELVPCLWKEEEVSTYVNVPCPGMTIGKEKVACSGPGLVNLTYDEAKICEGIKVSIESNRKKLVEVENNLMSPVQSKYVVSAAIVNHVIQKTLKHFEKDLGKGVIGSVHLPLANELFTVLAKSTTENWLNIPPLRHFISECLENLATIVVSQGECSAKVILEILAESPYLSSMLTPHFTPKLHEIPQLYEMICDIPLGDGFLCFVLLSKMDLPEWLHQTTNPPEPAHIAAMISLLFRNLEITGVVPSEQRQMIHGLHRKHLIKILEHSFPQHYLEILTKILNLCSCNMMDPDVLYDLLNSVTNTATLNSVTNTATLTKLVITADTDPADVKEHILNYAQTAQDYDLLTVVTILSKVSMHFEKDRLNFGLYGLYPKYRCYIKPLSYLFLLLGNQLVCKRLAEEQGALSAESIAYLWKHLKTLFDPWICPINPGALQATASWIQQLSDQGSSLMPWIPGDSGHAKLMLDAAISCIHPLLQTSYSANRMLSNILHMYTNYYAMPETKDHIYGVVHPALSALNWKDFLPELKDIEAMTKIITKFLPQSHAFLGAIFIQIEWQHVINEKSKGGNVDVMKKLLPALFCLMVKLSSEPSVRQGGRLLSIITQSESWDWSYVDAASHYEALAQWYVMSVDCRCIVKHKERNPVDAAVIRLFVAASEFVPNQIPLNGNAERKQIVWVKCCTKLLTMVCNKQKNFLSLNQPALHTTLRKLLDEINTAGTVLCAEAMVKDYLNLFNTTTSSVLPGSALTVTQSWLVNTSSAHSLPAAFVIQAFLSQIGPTVKDEKFASALMESILEAYFQNEDGRPSWAYVRSIMRWPLAGPPVKLLLDSALGAGHVLVLYAYVDLKQADCLNIEEEQALGSTILEFLRLLTENVGQEVEPQLPLLYKKLILVIQRQFEYGKDAGWPLRCLSQFSELLIQAAESSQSWGRNILGAIGLGNSNAQSLRGKFLARALAIFLRTLMDADKTRLIEKIMDIDSGAAAENAEAASASSRLAAKTATLNTPEMKGQLEKLKSFKSNKGFSGFQDLLFWVLNQVEVETNTIKDAGLFLDYLVIDKLYTELYLRN